MALYTLGQRNPTDLLICLEFFSYDKTLPKYLAASQAAGQATQLAAEQDLNADNPFVEADSESVGLTFTNRRMSGITFRSNMPKGLLGRLLTGLVRLFRKVFNKPEPVTKVFTRIKTSAEELAGWSELDKQLTQAIAAARTTGQVEMLRKLETEQEVRRFENLLYCKGRKRYLTEQQLLQFVAKCERGLCLDYIRDYVRPIPPEVVAEKAKCDAEHLFDNYLILHYDPLNRSTTPEAREKAKDPILFGVLANSRKLYFVADWVDELCDLTFDDIVKTLGSPLELEPNPNIVPPRKVL